MEISTASTRMQGLITLYDMQTAFFEKAITGVSETDMHNRLGTKANHMAWLSGALVEQRYHLVKETHPGLKQTRDELFKDNKGIQEGLTYPSNQDYIQDWDRVSPVAREVLVSATDEQLDSEIDMGFMKMSYYELISFTIYREASIIGQLALWRRLLDYPALKYD
jgi:hypothetical protein